MSGPSLSRRALWLGYQGGVAAAVALVPWGNAWAFGFPVRTGAVLGALAVVALSVLVGALTGSGVGDARRATWDGAVAGGLVGALAGASRVLDPVLIRVVGAMFREVEGVGPLSRTEATDALSAWIGGVALATVLALALPAAACAVVAAFAARLARGGPRPPAGLDARVGGWGGGIAVTWLLPMAAGHVAPAVGLGGLGWSLATQVEAGSLWRAGPALVVGAQAVALGGAALLICAGAGRAVRAAWAGRDEPDVRLAVLAVAIGTTAWWASEAAGDPATWSWWMALGVVVGLVGAVTGRGPEPARPPGLLDGVDAATLILAVRAVLFGAMFSESLALTWGPTVAVPTWFRGEPLPANGLAALAQALSEPYMGPALRLDTGTSPLLACWGITFAAAWGWRRWRRGGQAPGDR